MGFSPSLFAHSGIFYKSAFYWYFPLLISNVVNDMAMEWERAQIVAQTPTWYFYFQRIFLPKFLSNLISWLNQTIDMVPYWINIFHQ